MPRSCSPRSRTRCSPPIARRPHAKPFARVEFDRETGDIRVFTLTLTAEELEGHPGVTYPEPEPPAEGEPVPLEPVEPEP